MGPRGDADPAHEREHDRPVPGRGGAHGRRGRRGAARGAVGGGHLMDAEALDARVAPLVERLYPDRCDTVRAQLVALAEQYAHLLSDRHVASPSHETVYLITYGDGIRRP